MSDLVIKVEELSKLYRLGKVGTGTLKNDLNRLWHTVRGKEDPFLKLGQKNDRTIKSKSDFMWALQDINFDISSGEVLGIIGRNGAGKSTLLKILSKITSPTTGEIKIKGRIASLLEVGTGFHPDLTGRENIYMNGAILGMRKWEIEKKLEEIIEFAGVAAYADTPVKRYSSGMIVRLGFAVAAHLEPEILVVDEVLAVGDVEFQKKCLGRMKDISKNDGRTVLFVSHNMAAIKSLCTRGLLLNKGCIEYNGDTDSCINLYLGSGQSSANINKRHYNDIFVEGAFKLNTISIKGVHASENDPLLENYQIELTTNFEILNNNPETYHITYHLINELGEPLFAFNNRKEEMMSKGNNNIQCYFPANFFQSGNYYLSLFVVENKKNPILIEKDIFAFTITDGPRELGDYMGRAPGYIRPNFEWKKGSV